MLQASIVVQKLLLFRQSEHKILDSQNEKTHVRNGHSPQKLASGEGVFLNKGGRWDPALSILIKLSGASFMI